MSLALLAEKEPNMFLCPLKSYFLVQMSKVFFLGSPLVWVLIVSVLHLCLSKPVTTEEQGKEGVTVHSRLLFLSPALVLVHQLHLAEFGSSSPGQC